MISKLPRWVWIGTWILAFIAGIVNVVGLLGFGHETMTHLTGNTSRLAEALAKLDFPGILHVAALLGAFVTGTIISGLIIEDSVLKIDGRYGIVLLIESFLLFVSVPLLKNQRLYGMYTAACACGLQNAMVSTYSGAVVRTTHLSGMFTDLGISMGHALRGLPVNMKRVSLCVLVISGFLSGGIVGTRLFQTFNYGALLFPAGLTAIVSIVYGLYQARKGHS
jgi:uncharacterized membrane protein YoaK (UPF0700 family)